MIPFGEQSPPDDPFQFALQCDENGIFPAPGESEEEFRTRVQTLSAAYEDLLSETDNGTRLDAALGLPVGEGVPISAEILDEAAETTDALYRFRIRWVPGFFLSKGLGILWGGCAVSTPENISFFFIRNAFRTRQNWAVYNRRELLSHELCHVARTIFHDHEFEELFAYRTSPSPLRRYLGNCFRKEFDAFLFVLPVFLLLLVQLCNFLFRFHIPEWPFWFLAATGPAFLLLRNERTRRTWKRAFRALSNVAPSSAGAILFRATPDEIRLFSDLTPGEIRTFVARNQQSELRWRVIAHRFFESPKPVADVAPDDPLIPHESVTESFKMEVPDHARTS